MGACRKAWVIEYRVLGPLEVREGDRPLPLGGAKQRAVLALLILNANRVVSRDRLIDELWGDEPPETVVTSVQVYVSRLRKLLPPETLVTRAPGYLLNAERNDIDLFRFERLVAAGREALGKDDPASAARVLRDALELWRGPALAEFAPEPFAQIEGGRLDDLRVATLEERIQADLALGRTADLIGELEVLIAEHPHRERLTGQLMLALYRSGRQTEALAAYRRLRSALDDLGLEPGENLQVLERQILNHDRELEGVPRAPAGAPAGAALVTTTPAPPLGRRSVTVLFAALATNDEAEEDPERTAALFDRLHAEAAAEIEGAGGLVERGLVGALLATFGATDDGDGDHARRGAGAAVATRSRLAREFGGNLVVRMGLESGDVLLGRPGASVAGAPVTAAARLVPLAQPDEIVVGERAAAAIGTAFDLRKHAGATILVEAGHAAPRVQTQPRPEVRKNVTVLFADLVDSTRLGEQLDPEAHRRLMSRYFDAMRSVIERHGGIVEKFIGDAVMAGFGGPAVHEDDALRAVRAAAEMREALATLNGDLDRIWGIRLAGRIGVNSGEVIAGDHRQGHMAVTGMPVVVAQRLEAAAATNEILIGEATYRLVRDAVGAEQVTRVVKGGAEVRARQLVEVRARVAGHARRFDSPLVGRDHELSTLRSAFATVERNDTCQLLTVLGPAGVGKSRLVQEFVREVDADATVVLGHCLPYGEGITYWPLGEVVRELVRLEGAGDAEPSSAAIAEVLDGEEKAELIGELIADALGLGSSGVAV